MEFNELVKVYVDNRNGDVEYVDDDVFRSSPSESTYYGHPVIMSDNLYEELIYGGVVLERFPIIIISSCPDDFLEHDVYVASSAHTVSLYVKALMSMCRVGKVFVISKTFKSVDI